ncbi:type II CAAX prenyl endopeptidase Rce1 family protein [Caulobacter sp. BE254]|uniref:CPBP family glutamic-type intramembrane protease n=1 Tax=Caulobacter sp. BE254 TaxID=2817720 RepID=UPI0028668FAD|nr:CPBP family glutamic-type intramembrane protease [Caulobacter sp. BE254]MDR7116768.1 putative Abi (CAAX) family protease [Caulobacter sp. BE254]
MPPLRRLRRALTTLPDARGWVLCGLVAAVTGGAMAALGFSTGLYAVTPTEPGLPLRLLTVLFVPALGEEIPFRGLLVPARDEAARPRTAITLSTALYVAWHPLETLTFLPKATMFLRPDFLACTAILGLGCALMRWRTGSLWPAVILHGGFVVVWQTWLGGVRL